LPADAAFRGGAGRSNAASGDIADVDGGGSPWLTWTFVGAAGLAGATTVGALVFREEHAGRWNDNTECLEVERTRAEVCGDERDKANTAETVALVSGALAGAFALGAVLNGLGVFESDAPPSELGLRGCNLGLAGASCFGTF
jgi:hypothetical protein